MKIIKSKSKPTNASVAIWYQAGLDAKHIDKSQKTFVEQKIEDKKELVSLDNLSSFTFVLNVKTEDRSEAQILEQYRKLGAQVFAKMNAEEQNRLFIDAKDVCGKMIIAFVEGLSLAAYSFTKYHSDEKKNKSYLEEISVNSDLKKEDLKEIENLYHAVAFSRDLVNEPLSYLTAEQLGKEIKKSSKTYGFSAEVLGLKQIEALKMGGLLAVNRGSFDPPTFSILEWKPEKPKNKKPIVIVGKGVVFDTGGLSLKPTAGSMDEMKSDMAGAAAVVGAMQALAANKLDVHVIALVPATDNRPGNKAYAPQDIICMHDGTKVEVLNTDAEGRMILADALSYAKKFKPELVIDLATLTGAAHAAIGQYGIVSMGNAKGKLKEQLAEAGDYVYERLVEFPFWEEYGELIQSDIADIKNIGGKVGGAITAGKFLEHFTDYPYIHLDIAGPAYIGAKDAYRTKGGTGVGVRLLYNFFKNYK
jgi:leucyl aminopeptidase